MGFNSGFKGLIAFKFYIKSHCCSPLPQFCFVSLDFPSASNIVSKDAQASLFSGIFDSVFLIANSSLICGGLRFSSSSLHLCASGHFDNRWYSLSSPAHKRHQTLSVPHPHPHHTSFIVQIASRNYATPVLSFRILFVVYASLPQECSKSPYSDNILFSLISASHLSLWISALSSVVKWLIWGMG